MSAYPRGDYYQQSNSRGYASSSGAPGPMTQNPEYRDERRGHQQQPYNNQQNPQQFSSHSKPPSQGYGQPQYRNPAEYGPTQGPPKPHQHSHTGYSGSGSSNSTGRGTTSAGFMNARYQGPNGQYVPHNRPFKSSPSPTAYGRPTTSPNQREFPLSSPREPFPHQQLQPKQVAPQQFPPQNTGYSGSGPKRQVYSNGYQGHPSAPDISTSMQNMSIQEPPRRPSAPASSMGYPPYNNSGRPQSPAIQVPNQTFYKHANEAGSNSKLMAPPAMNNAPGRGSPVAMAQRRNGRGVAAPVSNVQPLPSPSSYAYDSVAYTDDNVPTSPTAVSADYYPQGGNQGDGYIRQPKISTNKIPPSSKAAKNGNQVSPEYRRDDYNQQRYDEPSSSSQYMGQPQHLQPQQPLSQPSMNQQQPPQQNQYHHNQQQRAVADEPGINDYNKNNSYDYENPYRQYHDSRDPQQQPHAVNGQLQSEVQPRQEPVEEVKPPPRRQYNTTDPLHEIPEQKGKQITVEDFELIRKRARVQSHDSKVQLDLAKKLVEASSFLAEKYSDSNTPGRAIDSKTVRKNREAWSAQAYKITKKLVGSSYPAAMFYLASNYSSGGLGLEVDYEKAYELYLKAAKLDHSEAAYRVAVCNEIGAGTRRDTEKALGWYKKAASLGDVSAMYKLGMISLNGLLGQPRSFTEAVTWLERACEKADADTPHAVHELGLLYERADSLDMSAINNSGNAMVIQKDERKAFELFMKAAKLGYAPSQFRLGCSYEYGTLGCQIDPKRSIAWYSKAAEKGEPESELALSGWYLTGSEGILQQSDTEAYLWARRAAEKGLAKAEYALGYFSEVGIGVRADVEEAKRWYLKAAAQKHPKASARLQEIRQVDIRK